MQTNNYRQPKVLQLHLILIIIVAVAFWWIDTFLQPRKTVLSATTEWITKYSAHRSLEEDMQRQQHPTLSEYDSMKP